MNQSDLIKLIRQVVREEMVPAFMGAIVSNESPSRSTVQRFESEPKRTNIRSVQPFGYASRAPGATPAFIAPAGNDPTNQNILGHFDEANRPAIGEGDVALYDAHGHVLYLSSGKIQLGSVGSAENLVLGKQLQQLLSQLLDLLANHTHPGIGSPPSNAAQFQSLKSSPVEDGAILSKISFTE